MSDNMNSRIFARKWLEKNGLFDKDSDYDGWLGEATMEVVGFIAKQGHSGASGPRMIELLTAIYDAYGTPNHPIWIEYWKSDEGRALIEEFGGGTVEAFLQALESPKSTEGNVSSLR